jgi:RNA polymerase sigma-70 factor (ECF subfamily)
MDAPLLNDRLSRIQTRWSLVIDAHQGQADAATRAQAALMQRYHGAIYRYILGAVRDANVADDLAQDFALRLVRGDFKKADPDRGRFRDFIKTAVYHLIVDYQRRRREAQLSSGLPEPADEESTLTSDRAFLERWKQELIDRAWEGLAQVEQASGQPFNTLLRYRAEHPEVRSAQMAELLEEKLGKPMTEVAIRKALQRARERFADLLLEEVARSLQTDSREAVEQELMDLDLLSYCKPALDRFGARKDGGQAD